MSRRKTPIETRYYLVYDRIVGKRENYGDCWFKEWLFQDGEWVPDTDFVIMDHLVGFDPTEPPESPYRIGSTSVLMEMDEISEDQAMALIAKQGR